MGEDSRSVKVQKTIGKVIEIVERVRGHLLIGCVLNRNRYRQKEKNNPSNWAVMLALTFGAVSKRAESNSFSLGFIFAKFAIL
jgi:hypothetical protein